MARVINLWLLIIIYSCTTPLRNKPEGNSNLIKNELNATKSDSVVLKKWESIVLIKLKNGISFNWNNEKGEFEEDNLFKYVLKKFEIIKLDLANEIIDTQETPARICQFHKNLVKGDLVFLLINRIKKIPNPIQMQLDVFENNCKYPSGYFEAINDDRIGIMNRTKQLLIK
jgi:hypothetical protein